MTLDQWMTANRVKNSALAKTLGCGRERVRRLRLARDHALKRWPKAEEWPLILAFTNGAVTPNAEHHIGGDASAQAAATP